MNLKNVILTEDDIPGVKIPRESFEHCRIWRMCPAKQYWSVDETFNFESRRTSTIMVVKQMPCLVLHLSLEYVSDVIFGLLISGHLDWSLWLSWVQI